MDVEVDGGDFRFLEVAPSEIWVTKFFRDTVFPLVFEDPSVGVFLDTPLLRNVGSVAFLESPSRCLVRECRWRALNNCRIAL